MKKKRKKWIWLVLLIVVAAVAVPMLQIGNPQSPRALEQEVATTGSITSNYSFTGNVKVKNSQSITATATATVREVYVREGDHVVKGDRLMRTSDGETIKAGVSGEVTTLHMEKDDDVKAGDALIDIVDFDSLIIEIKVDEFDVPAVVVGKTAHVTVNALNETFETTVTRLDRQATQEGNVSYYTATLALGDLQGVLPGMQVDVKLLNAHAENVTTLSMNALQFTDTNQPYVMIQGSNGVQNVPVTVGVNDGIRVEILSGVRSGDTVLIPAKAAPNGMMFMGGGPGGSNGGFRDTGGGPGGSNGGFRDAGGGQ